MKWPQRVSLRRIDYIAILAVVAVIGFISQLPSPRDRNPAIPAAPPHEGLAERQCSDCHTANGRAPLTARHPKRQDCFRCHRPATVNVTQPAGMAAVALLNQGSYHPKELAMGGIW